MSATVMNSVELTRCTVIDVTDSNLGGKLKSPVACSFSKCTPLSAQISRITRKLSSSRLAGDVSKLTPCFRVQVCRTTCQSNSACFQSCGVFSRLCRVSECPFLYRPPSVSTYDQCMFPLPRHCLQDLSLKRRQGFFVRADLRSQQKVKVVLGPYKDGAIAVEVSGVQVRMLNYIFYLGCIRCLVWVSSASNFPRIFPGPLLAIRRSHMIVNYVIRVRNWGSTMICHLCKHNDSLWSRSLVQVTAADVDKVRTCTSYHCLGATCVVS